ncbi:toll-like receptor 13 [Culex quinquefasciatus]|uniref:toll-like receptor 13 n=1 Tax=Culex quinquefasciatus TaxID=7176 RepID=UPI0018E363EA|nr:toll-like receptor 13 [Culex quinquefasciatus]
MEVRTVILLVLQLLLLGQSVVDAQIGCQSDDDVDCDGKEGDEFSNGYENFLPVESGDPYRIRLRKFDYLIGVNPECILGSANNYLPWLFPNGSLTIRSSSQALDVSNLKLNDNAMESVVEKLETMLNFSDIRYLSLANNRLTELPADSLLLFPNLEHLSLMFNPLKEFTAESNNRPKIPNLQSLVTLDMRYCGLGVLPADFFHDVPKLQFLFLSHNYITKLPAPLFNRLNKLVHLDLSYMDSSLREEEARMENPFMKLITGMDMDSNVFQPLNKLRFLDLSHSKLDLKAFIALSSLGAKLEYVSYCYTDLPTLMDYLFQMESIKMLDLSGNLGCGRALNELSFSLLRNSLEVLYFKNASIFNLKWMSGLRNLRVLNLRGNFLSTLEYGPFNELVSLEALDVSNNFIQSWSCQLFANNTKMYLLNARHNNLLLITTSMLRDFEPLKYLAVGVNTIQCTCNYVYFLQMIMGNSSAVTPQTELNSERSATETIFSIEHLKLYDFDEAEYYCMNFTGKRRVNAIELQICSREDEGGYNNISEPASEEPLEDDVEEYLVIYVISSLLVILALLSLLGIYWYWFYIKYFFVILKNSAILSFFNDDKLYLDKSALVEEAPFNYDVFVSYSDNDRSWVLEEMLPNLEREDLLTVCLHERDFEVGYGILENIISCMDRSRCLMLIVSESFLMSRWCQFEMHLAQHRLLETRRDELILVLLEDIPRRKCPKTLGFLMKTKTYIKWPKERTQEKELFWKRLRKALLTSKC